MFSLHAVSTFPPLMVYVAVKKDNTKVLLLDLAPGKWNAVCGDKKFTFDVTKKEGCIYAVFNRGTWQISPVTK